MFVILLCLILYGANEALFKGLEGPLSWFFAGYYNDLLAPALLISFVSIVYFLTIRQIVSNFWWCLLLVMFSGVFWEYITPLYKESVSDPFDLFAYLVGFLGYWVLARFPLKEKWKNTINVIIRCSGV